MADYNNDPYQRPLLSLADAKTLKVADGLNRKQLKQNPNASTTAELAAAARQRSQRGTTDGLDLAESALYRSGGIVMDALKGVSNSVFDTEFDDQQDTGWSNQRTADEMANVSQDYRSEFQAKQQNVVDRIANDDIMGSLAAAWDVAPQTLADSAGVIPELIVGAGLTAAGAAMAGPAGAVPGAAVLARRGQKVAEGADKLFGAVADAKDLRKTKKLFRKEARVMRKGESFDIDSDVKTMLSWDKKLRSAAESGSKSLLKGAGQTSIINMEMTQNARNQYIEEYGEEPTPGRVAATAMVNAVTLSVDPMIWKKLYLPKMPKIDKTKGLRAQFQDELKAFAKTADRGMIENIARAVGSGAAKIGKAGGAEAVQEYAQSWGEILSVHVDPARDGGFWQSVMGQLQEEGNVNETIAASFMGGMAGGQIRGVTAAPVVGARVVTEAAAKTGKKIADKAAEKTAIKDFGTLDDETKARLAKEVEADEALIAEKETQNAAFITELEGATKFEDIKNDTIKKDILNRIGDRDVKDPEVFKNMVTGMKKYYAEETKYLKGKKAVSAYAKKSAELVKSMGKDVYKKVVESLPEDMVERLTDLEIAARDKVDDAVDWVKDFDTEQAIVFGEMAIDDTVTNTKEGTKKWKASANKQTVEVLRKTADKIRKNAPRKAEFLDGVANRKDDALKRTGLKSEKVTDFKKLDTRVKEVAQNVGNINPVADAVSIREQMKTAPGDIETVKTLQKAIETYGRSDAVKAQKDAKGVLTADEVKRFRKKLDKYQDALATPVADTIEGIATNLAKRGLRGAMTLPKIAKAAVSKAPEFVKDVVVGNEKKNVVQSTKLGQKFLQSLEQSKQDIQGKEGAELDEDMSGLVSAYISPDLVKRYPDMFDTRDPEVVASIIGKYLPIPTRAVVQGIAKHMPEPATQLEEKVSREKRAESVPLTPTGDILIDEAGVLTIDKVVTTKAEKEAVYALRSGATIC